MDKSLDNNKPQQNRVCILDGDRTTALQCNALIIQNEKGIIVLSDHSGTDICLEACLEAHLCLDQSCDKSVGV